MKVKEMIKSYAESLGYIVGVPRLDRRFVINHDDRIMPYNTVIMLGMGWDKMCDMGRDLFFMTGGKEVQWAPSAIKKREELEGPMWEAWIADKEKRGLPGRKAVDDLYNIFKDLGVVPTAVGYAPAK